MLASLALLASLAQEPATAAVRIDVVVRDAAGRAIETLKSADFQLREDGTAQALTDVQLVHGSARLIGVYLDEYYVRASKTAAVKAALHRFIDGLDAADRVVILRPLDSLLKITLTTGPAVLHRAIDAFEGRRGDYEPRTEFERSLLAGDRARADIQRVQSTWSTLNALTLHLANLGAGRSSLLLVSEQADPPVRRRGFEALPSSTAVTRTANRSNVSIYVFDPREAGEQAASTDEGPNPPPVLADRTH